MNKGNEREVKGMKKQEMTREKIKKRCEQVDERSKIREQLTEREKGYLDGCIHTVAALASQKRAG